MTENGARYSHKSNGYDNNVPNIIFNNYLKDLKQSHFIFTFIVININFYLEDKFSIH